MGVMLNHIWLGLIVSGVLVASFLGRLGGDDGIVETAIGMSKTAVVSLALPLAGYMMMWLGLMRLAEKSGLMRIVAALLKPVMRRLFPEVPADHPAMGAMVMNMAANMLGLGNAATPLGLRAMQHLNDLNPHKGTASNAMCTFLAINTSSVTLIPTTAVGLLASAGVTEPYAIIGPAILATACSTMVAIAAVKFFQRLPAFALPAEAVTVAGNESVESGEETDGGEAEKPERKPMTGSQRLWVGLLLVAMGMVVVFELAPGLRDGLAERTGIAELVAAEEARGGSAGAVEDEGDDSKPPFVQFMLAVSVVAIPLVFLGFASYAGIRGVRVFEEFVEGAKEGFQVAVRIMPYLVAMLVAMGIFRDSGALMLLQWLLSPVLELLRFPVDLLPMALMRPLSGGGSLGILGEILASDAVIAVKYAAATMFGSTETTFYVLAVYFGSVSIRRSRHALAAGLCADLAGVIAAVLICRVLFG